MGSETWTHMIINQVSLNNSRKPISALPIFIIIFVCTYFIGSDAKKDLKSFY